LVLVTRPRGSAADSLCAELEAAGFATAQQPLLELHALEELPATARQRVLDLDLYQHVIFISANAVRFGMAQIDNLWPQLPLGLNWYAIGAATAKLLETHGVSAITPGALMTSEGLLAVPSLQHVQDQRVLIIKGEGGRDTLATELAARGARVDTLACYRRSVPALPVGELAARIRDAEVAAILISSGEGLANLVQLLRPAETSTLAAVCLFVPSERVAQMAREAGFEQVVTAENASDAAMLAALEQWNNSSGE
jgi:uroporphyrinogen-III synthase